MGALVAERGGSSMALQPAGSHPRLADEGTRRWRTRTAWALGFALATVAIFACCLRQSQTVAVTADDSSNALQAWAMLHGNLLLHHWVLSDVPFYTTELPKYMLAEAILGLGANVVHVVAAATYTLLVLLSALLAKGRATGRAGIARMLLAGGIMLTPQLGSGTYTLLLSPDHLGAGVPLLLTWLLLDRARPRWYVPVAVWALLTLALVGDPLVLLIGVAPLAITGTVRLGRVLRRSEQKLRSGWYDASLAIAAVLSVEGASLAAHLVKAHGGWTTFPVKTALADNGGVLLSNLRITGEGLLELFGADVFARPPDHNAVFTLFAAIHLAGVGLAAWAFWLALRRFFRWDDIIVQVIVLAIILNVAAYASGVYASNIHSTREIAVVLPFAAVLVGRLLAGRLAAARVAPALAVVGLCYALIVGVYVIQPTVRPANSNLAAWLSAHHLSGGLSGFWQANSVTLDSHGTVDVRAVLPNLTPRQWENNLAAFDPRSSYANFVIYAPRSPGAIPPATAAKMFGRPARVYKFSQYTILVWNKNLLSPAALSHHRKK